MKKIFAIMLALVLVLAMAAPAMAEEGSITVNNAVDGRAYTAYQIFKVASTSGEGDNKNVSYQVNPEWANFFATGAAGANYVTVQNGYVTGGSLDKTNVAAFAAAAMEYVTGNGLTSNLKATAENGTATITISEAGYYLVDSNLGSICSLNAGTGMNVEVDEKNSVPGLTKTFSDGSTANKSASIGDTIDYKITVTNGAGTDQDITVHDVMDAGLTFKNDIVVKNGETTLTKDTDYTVAANTADGYTFEVVLKADYVKNLAATDTIVITYSATLNENAEISTNTNDNTAWLTYSNQTSTESKVSVVTYQFDLVKTDTNKKLLNGAKFRLLDKDGNEIKVVADESNYRVAKEGETGAEIEAGKVTISGLAAGTYSLVETEAPAGYNMLAAPVPVDLTKGNLVATMSGDGQTYVSGGVRVENSTGSELPSTGGIGTTIFYAIGGLLMAAAVVLLVTRRKVASGK